MKRIVEEGRVRGGRRGQRELEPERIGSYQQEILPSLLPKAWELGEGPLSSRIQCAIERWKMSWWVRRAESFCRTRDILLWGALLHELAARCDLNYEGFKQAFDDILCECIGATRFVDFLFAGPPHPPEPVVKVKPITEPIYIDGKYAPIMTVVTGYHVEAEDPS